VAKLVLLWDDHRPTYFTNWGKKNKGGVSHGGLAIYIKKYVKAKKEEELWKLKYFTMQNIY
jgi:hypothetical protein